MEVCTSLFCHFGSVVKMFGYAEVGFGEIPLIRLVIPASLWFNFLDRMFVDMLICLFLGFVSEFCYARFKMSGSALCRLAAGGLFCGIAWICCADLWVTVLFVNEGRPGLGGGFWDRGFWFLIWLYDLVAFMM